MSKHTPGPWKTCGASAGRCSCGLIWSIPADVVVAQLSNEEDSPQRTSDEGAANAALIAAAPDMLAALQDVRSVIDYCLWEGGGQSNSNLAENLRLKDAAIVALIKRAKGEV